MPGSLAALLACLLLVCGVTGFIVNKHGAPTNYVLNSMTEMTYTRFSKPPRVPFTAQLVSVNVTQSCYPSLDGAQVSKRVVLISYNTDHDRICSLEEKVRNLVLNGALAVLFGRSVAMPAVKIFEAALEGSSRYARFFTVPVGLLLFPGHLSAELRANASLTLTFFQDPTPPDQRAALRSLYTQTIGDNWLFSITNASGSSWDVLNPDSDPCLDHWQGVVCNPDGSIRQLCLYYISLAVCRVAQVS